MHNNTTQRIVTIVAVLATHSLAFAQSEWKLGPSAERQRIAPLSSRPDPFYLGSTRQASSWQAPITESNNMAIDTESVPSALNNASEFAFEIRQLVDHHVELGAMMAAEAMKHVNLLETEVSIMQLDSELQSVANRVLKVNKVPRSTQRTQIPNFVERRSQLDSRIQVVVEKLSQRLALADQRIADIRHVASINSSGADESVLGPILKSVLTPEEVDLLAAEFINQESLLASRKQLSPEELGRATRLGYLQYIQQLVNQDKQAIAKLLKYSSQWANQMERLEEIGGEIASRLASLEQSGNVHKHEDQPLRYSLMVRAIWNTRP